LIALVLAVVAWVDTAHSDPAPAPPAELVSSAAAAPTTLETVDAALVELVQPYTTHPIIAEPAYRNEIARAIVRAGAESKVPPLFLAAMFFRESSYRKSVTQNRVRGTRDETGIGQVNGVARAWCKRKGFDLATIDGQARCGAGWLRMCINTCGGQGKAGFALYATGRSCDPRDAGKVVEDRFALWKRLESGRAESGRAETSRKADTR
jgi:hypothetical protein